MEASGKTLLCRRLQGLHRKEAPSVPFNTYTVATSGIQLTEVACPKGTPHIKSLMMREVGGQMAPLWPTYFEDCRMVLFVVDASDAAAVAPAAVELCEMMSHPAMADKPVCVVLTKQDHALVLSRQELELVMHLSDLERACEPGQFCVVEASAIPGGFAAAPGGAEREGMRFDGAALVLEWMVERKAAALGLPHVSVSPLGAGQRTDYG
ncbi:hypothetical protein FOA52_000577 [Chlamydomonas sp. UWO 241]|nr:hypothetical protein FOA52_000577 [Chlamydomonas sp. UWO 241]